jgi:hypothetical protein
LTEWYGVRAIIGSEPAKERDEERIEGPATQASAEAASAEPWPSLKAQRAPATETGSADEEPSGPITKKTTVIVISLA